MVNQAILSRVSKSISTLIRKKVLRWTKIDPTSTRELEHLVLLRSPRTTADVENWTVQDYGPICFIQP